MKRISICEYVTGGYHSTYADAVQNTLVNPTYWDCGYWVPLTISHLFGEDVSVAFQQSTVKRRILIKAIVAKYPGILEGISFVHRGNPLELACHCENYDEAHFLLDVGARGTAFACNILVCDSANFFFEPDCSLHGDNLSISSLEPSVYLLLKRIVRRGGIIDPKVGELCKEYQKEFELARDASHLLIGICKLNRSPLIPRGVHCDIIKRIVYYMRRLHENRDIY